MGGERLNTGLMTAQNSALTDPRPDGPGWWGPFGPASPRGMVSRSSHRSRSQRPGWEKAPESTPVAAGACILAAGAGDASIASQLVARNIAGVIRNMIALP